MPQLATQTWRREITCSDEGERARDGGRRHTQHMRQRVRFLVQPCTLLHAEPADATRGLGSPSLWCRSNAVELHKQAPRDKLVCSAWPSLCMLDPFTQVRQSLPAAAATKIRHENAMKACAGTSSNALRR